MFIISKKSQRIEGLWQTSVVDPLFGLSEGWEARMNSENFKKVLFEAVDNGLLTLGESPRCAIYFRLEKNWQLKKEEIPQKVEKFLEGLENIFGPGSRVVEKVIVEDLYKKLGLEFEEKMNFEFQDYVKQALKQLKKEMSKGKKRKAETKL
jgi:hypothetical protein